MKTIKLLILAIATYIPGIDRILESKTGGTDSARYCYSVWLRHLVLAEKNGLDSSPKTVAELGPGDSIGIGLAALISGCEKYFAFDVVEYNDVQRSLDIFDELVTLFKNKTPIPGDKEFPAVKPLLENYEFPSHILDSERLERVLETSRLEKIRNSIATSQQDKSFIQYKVPWNDSTVLEKESVDMIYSQAVLEHVDNLPFTYQSMKSWLKPTGYVSHAIDFKCHGTASEWNGHWAYSDLMWKLLRGNRTYLLNREPHSTHIKMMKNEGFDIVCDNSSKSTSDLTKKDLAPRFQSIPDQDLFICDSFIQGIKKEKVLQAK